MKCSRNQACFSWFVKRKFLIRVWECESAHGHQSKLFSSRHAGLYLSLNHAHLVTNTWFPIFWLYNWLPFRPDNNSGAGLLCIGGLCCEAVRGAIVLKHSFLSLTCRVELHTFVFNQHWPRWRCLKWLSFWHTGAVDSTRWMLWPTIDLR